VKKEFDLTPHENEDFVCKVDFLNKVRKSPTYYKIRELLARDKAYKGELEPETVDEMLQRLEVEADYYVEWEDVLDFFTRKGRPAHIAKKLK